jgi:MFS transporter, ACS family, glucarate transporter
VRDQPARHPWVGEGELAYINANKSLSSSSDPNVIAFWKDIVLSRQVVLLALSYFCFGYVAYIFFTWFFTYLSTVRGLNLRSSGIYGTLPFIAMAVASPLGGYISDKLTIRFNKRIGRCVVAAVGMLFAALFVGLATQVQEARLASVVLAAGSGSLYLAQSAFWTLSADLGGSSAGSVSGVMNMGGQIGGAITASLTPILAETFGWSGSLLFAAGISVIGALVWIFIDPYAQLVHRTEDLKVLADRAGSDS